MKKIVLWMPFDRRIRRRLIESAVEDDDDDDDYYCLQIPQRRTILNKSNDFV